MTAVGRADRPRARAVRLPRIAGERAAERTTRVLAFGFLPAAVLFGLFAALQVAEQGSHWPAWWNAPVFTGIIGLAGVLGAVAFTAPVRVLRGLAWTLMGVTLAAQAGVPFVVVDPAGLAAPAWLTGIGALGLVVGGLLGRPGVAVAVAAAGSVLSAVDRLATDPSGGAVAGLQYGLYILLFSLTFIALGLSSLSASRAADIAEADASVAAAAIAREGAKDRERARVNELVHDRVLATLLAAARPVPEAAALTRRDAERALAGLHALLQDDGPGVDAGLDAIDFVWKVQAATTGLVPDALFGHEAATELRLPERVADVLLAATEEALRNSRRHAGAAANRTVHVEVADDGVRIDVLDDGEGFERAAVPPERLGIAESIEGRMRSLPGGSAHVISSRGVGTRVRMAWRWP